jgi:hypothetical protein
MCTNVVRDICQQAKHATGREKTRSTDEQTKRTILEHNIANEWRTHGPRAGTRAEPNALAQKIANEWRTNGPGASTRAEPNTLANLIFSRIRISPWMKNMLFKWILPWGLRRGGLKGKGGRRT